MVTPGSCQGRPADDHRSFADFQQPLAPGRRTGQRGETLRRFAVIFVFQAVRGRVEVALEAGVAELVDGTGLAQESALVGAVEEGHGVPGEAPGEGGGRCG